jgi:hypothetical protein
MKPRIVFVARALETRWPDIDSLDEFALERQHERVRSGVDVWIVQSYVRVRAALESLGFEVCIGGRFERGAICVAHRDDLNRYADPLHDCLVVGVRADRPPLRVARIEVVQNPLQAGSPRARFVPHWPQPGLIPRETSRGPRIERIAYFGREDSIPAWYSDLEFRAQLARLGLVLEIRSKAWNDYGDVDVLLAHRDETPLMLRNKPASKLVNAWLACVPAILAPEPAFEQLKRSDLDFIATTSASTTIQALHDLVRSPDRYHAMVENGRERAREFSTDAVRQRWIELMVRDVVPAFERWRQERAPRIVRLFRHFTDMSAQKIEAKQFRRQQRREMRAMNVG